MDACYVIGEKHLLIEQVGVRASVQIQIEYACLYANKYSSCTHILPGMGWDCSPGLCRKRKQIEYGGNGIVGGVTSIILNDSELSFDFIDHIVVKSPSGVTSPVECNCNNTRYNTKKAQLSSIQGVLDQKLHGRKGNK